MNIKEWRRKHAGDQCVCKHSRGKHYTLGGAQSDCQKCDCKHFEKRY